MKKMGRYQHQSILIAKLLNPIDGCIIQSIFGVHASRIAKRFGVSLVDFGQFYAILDDFDVDFGQMSLLFKEGNASYALFGRF